MLAVYCCFKTRLRGLNVAVLHHGTTALELETKVHPKVRNHGEGPYQGLLLVESGYYRFHIKDTIKTLCLTDIDPTATVSRWEIGMLR